MMMVKPRGNKPFAAMRAGVAPNSGTPAHFSDTVEKDFGSRPDARDDHLRSRVTQSLAATEEH